MVVSDLVVNSLLENSFSVDGLLNRRFDCKQLTDGLTDGQFVGKPFVGKQFVNERFADERLADKRFADKWFADKQLLLNCLLGGFARQFDKSLAK